MREYTNQCLKPLMERLRKGRIRQNQSFHLVVSGTVVELLRQHQPRVLLSLKRLIAHKTVNLVAHPYYNSALGEESSNEYDEQTGLHRALMETTFQKTPVALKRRRVFTEESPSPLLEKLRKLEGLIKGGKSREALRHWRILQDGHYYKTPNDPPPSLQNIVTDLEVSAFMKKFSTLPINRPQLLLLL